jgi:AcrR family transcriptional regulator
MSPRTEEQNAQIKDERREQILSAALRVFAQRGFAATKVGDIAAAAGLSHGLVYHYFASKEEMFYELVRVAVKASGDSLLMVDAMPIPPMEKVRQTAKYIMDGIAAGQDTSYFFLIVTHAGVMEAGPERDGSLAGSDVAVRTLAKILREGQQAGQVREGDPMGMSVMFFSAIMGLAIYNITMPGFVMPDPELLVSMVAKGSRE